MERYAAEGKKRNGKQTKIGKMFGSTMLWTVSGEVYR